MAVRILIAVFILVAFYLLLPSPQFPPPPPDSYISLEPADTESIYRQAYFTDLDRARVMSYYQSAFRLNPDIGLVRLNHPPEESATLIRDQTRSSWLEELVHPGRESLFINGFYPTKPTEQINREGRHYQAKIIVRLVPSAPVARLTVWSLAVGCAWLLTREYAHV